MNQEETIYSCLEPRGEFFDIELFSLSTRIEDINKKTIYFVDNGKTGSEFLLRTTMSFMEKSFPDVRLVYYPKTTPFHQPEPESWWKEIELKADAAVVSVGD